MRLITKLSGLFIFLSFLVSIYSYFFDKNILIISGILICIAGTILFFEVKQKRLLSILLLLSLFSFIFCYINNYCIDYIKIFTVNQYLLTLLISVGFLKLVAQKMKIFKTYQKVRNHLLEHM